MLVKFFYDYKIYILIFIILFIGYLFYPLFKHKSKNKKLFQENDFDKITNNKRLQAKKHAIEILQMFNINSIDKKLAGSTKNVTLSLNNPDSVSDDDLIMEFSRLSDEATMFNPDWVKPGGVAGGKTTTRIDGIIWGLAYAPDFIKTVIPHDEFVKIWKNEREKKLEGEAFIKQMKANEIADSITDNTDYIVELEQVEYIDIEGFYLLFKEAYENYIFEKFNFKFDSPFKFFEILAMKSGYPNLITFVKNFELITFNNCLKFIVKKKN